MKNKGIIIFIVILMIIVVVAGGILIYQILNHNTNIENNPNNINNNEQNPDSEDEKLVVEEKEPEIFKGNERPIAVMIDNHPKAWPQANLNKAYLVYEIIVEGGETRLMAVFKNQDLQEIGPVRSARHYFLDYALENDAIYVHHGWSPQAERDIPNLRVDYINGIQESAKDFWREKSKSVPHNLFTSTESILTIAKRKGYDTTSNKNSVLNYVAYDVDLNEKYGIKEDETNQIIENIIDSSNSEQTTVETQENISQNENTSQTTTTTVENMEELQNSETTSENNQNVSNTKTKVIKASTITIPHSSLEEVQYIYDEETKRYTRYAREKLQTDYSTGENITTKNIIITMCDNYTLNDSENKGRQGLDNIGTFDGYYITNGYAIPIKCTKVARSSQTQYKDLDGNTIEVSDGNTFIHICPKKADIVIE